MSDEAREEEDKEVEDKKEEEEKEEVEEREVLKLKPPVASRAAVNKKLGLTQGRQAQQAEQLNTQQSRQAQQNTSVRVVANEEEGKVGINKEGSNRANENTIGDGEDLLGNVTERREVLNPGGKDFRGGGERGDGVLREDGGEIEQGAHKQNRESKVEGDKPEHRTEIRESIIGESAGGRVRSRSGGGGGEGGGGVGSLSTGMSTLERVSKVSHNRTTVTYWSEQFL